MEVQENEAASWVTVRGWGREKSIREASPDMTHHNKFAKLANKEDVSSGVALLQQDTSSYSRGNVCSST